MIKKMQLPCVLIEGVPGENTVGWVGLFAMNTLSANGDLYKCVKAESGVYTWVAFGDGSGGSGGGTGADGYSPEAYVEQTDYGAVIHITDKSGTTEATVYNGEDGLAGADGYSPILSVSKVGKVTTITITDAEGTKTATINDGEDGAAGGDGAGGGTGSDGVGIASIVQTTKSNEDDGVNIITITLTDGSVHTFEVQNGSKGSQGNPGTNGTDGVSATHSWNGTTLTVTSASGASSANLKGDKGETGTAGKDGKTPEKGVDYFTAAEKAEMVSEAAAEIPISNYVPKSGTTMTGALTAQANTNYTTRQVRNVIYLADGASVPTTQNGDLVLFYK